MNQTTISVDCLTGLSDQHIQYLTNGIGINKRIVLDYTKMQHAALSDGIELNIASGFRSFERQLSIFNRKIKGELPTFDLNNQQVNIERLSVNDKLDRILLFSALPGASRHHWGTDIDVYSKTLLNGKALQLEAWEYEDGGPLQPLTTWLDNHMAEFGFYRPYDVYRGGVAPEPWHLSHKRVAKAYAQLYQCEHLQTCLEHSNIENKDDILQHISELYEKFVINVNPNN